MRSDRRSARKSLSRRLLPVRVGDLRLAICLSVCALAGHLVWTTRNLMAATRWGVGRQVKWFSRRAFTAPGEAGGGARGRTLVWVELQGARGCCFVWRSLPGSFQRSVGSRDDRREPPALK
jgi:hypothetical protein